MRRVALLAATLVALGASAPAQADTGAISNVYDTGTGTVAASYSVAWQTCKDYGSGILGCSWYAVAYERPADAECIPDDGGIAWVGDFHTEPGAEAVTADTFWPNDEDGDVRLCLYAKPQDRAPVLLSQVVYHRPRLSLRAAKIEARRVLRKRYGRHFRHGRGVRLACYHTVEDEAHRGATCRVRWRYGHSRRYSGLVELKRTAKTRVVHFVFVHRTRP